jgi:putative Holliday junction resolvase
MPGTPEHKPETIVAFDFGRRRIGVAVGQQVTRSASAIGVVSNSSAGPDWQAIDRIVADWQPARLVVGVPSHADGTPSELTASIIRFMDELQRYGRPVESTDENYSSQEAGQMLATQRALGLRGRVRKENIDSTAAVLIAERWLGKDGFGNPRENATDLV